MQHGTSLPGSIMGYGSLLFNVFRYFLKTIRSFIVQFCTDPLVTVIPLLLYSLKSFTLRTLLLVILFFAHFGVSSFTWEQFSISHEIWHKCPWNDFDDHYTKKNTTVCPTLLVAKFGGFWAHFEVKLCISWEPLNILSSKFAQILLLLPQ